MGRTKAKPQPEPGVKTIYFDPFQNGIIQLKVRDWTDDTIARLLCSPNFTHVPIGPDHLLWFDSDGMGRKPAYPAFKIPVNLDEFSNLLGIFGYGILTGRASNPFGPVDHCQYRATQVCEYICFEPRWERRLCVDDYIDQIMRVYPFSDCWQ